MTEQPVDPLVAMTGEISVRGLVRPVGGIQAKIEAAIDAGIKKIIIPQQNWQQGYSHLLSAQIVPVTHLEEVFREALLEQKREAALPV